MLHLEEGRPRSLPSHLEQDPLPLSLSLSMSGKSQGTQINNEWAFAVGFLQNGLRSLQLIQVRGGLVQFVFVN